MQKLPPRQASNDACGARLVDFSTGRMYHLLRGAALYRLGREVAPAWHPDAVICVFTDAEVHEFTGWLLEQGKEFMKRKRVRDALDPDPHDPRPPEALPLAA